MASRGFVDDATMRGYGPQRTRPIGPMTCGERDYDPRWCSDPQRPLHGLLQQGDALAYATILDWHPPYVEMIQGT